MECPYKTDAELAAMTDAELADHLIEAAKESNERWSHPMISISSRGAEAADRYVARVRAEVIRRMERWVDER